MAAARAAAAVGGAGGGVAVEACGGVALETGHATVDVADVARERTHVYTTVCDDCRLAIRSLRGTCNIANLTLPLCDASTAVAIPQARYILQL